MRFYRNCDRQKRAIPGRRQSLYADSGHCRHESAHGGRQARAARSKPANAAVSLASVCSASPRVHRQRNGSKSKSADAPLCRDAFPLARLPACRCRTGKSFHNSPVSIDRAALSRFYLSSRICTVPIDLIKSNFVPETWCYATLCTISEDCNEQTISHC